MNGDSSEPAVNAIFLPLRSAGLLMLLSAGTSRPMSFLPNEAGDALDRKPLRTRNGHRRVRGVADVVFAVADDLHGRDRAVAIVDRDIEAVLGEQPFLHGEMDGGVRGPGRPIEPHLELVGGERGSAGERESGKGCSERDEWRSVGGEKTSRSAPVHAGLISKSEMKV